jgi:hypothetical protein
MKCGAKWLKAISARPLVAVKLFDYGLISGEFSRVHLVQHRPNHINIDLM